ncbi:aminotransferase class V-fold PLP-dependent enzyme [Streptosporangium sp. NBC_01495]|uniref:aminotransferase class V-fold PLP-dependent enzyme n=1 Tax=Streptosporangium sp. NBC_01495 TaxID=2903899 RepID=UPI002E32CBB6|nr:aminotransferase class V-fold PLP-dependent enzyme [Streptosporangium sp. NBC_01495]
MLAARDLRVTVVGAGPVACLVAIELRKRSFEVSLYERGSDVRLADGARGHSFNLTLTRRGLTSLDEHIVDMLYRNGVVLPQRVIHHVDGTTSCQPYGTDPDLHHLLSIPRGLLHEMLLDEAEKAGARLNFGFECIGVEPGSGSATFVDGGAGIVRTSADLLIGCDGANSIVRHEMFRRGAQMRISQDYVADGFVEIRIPALPGGGHALLDAARDPDRPRHTRHGLHIWPRGEFMLLAQPNVDGSYTAGLWMPLVGGDGEGGERLGWDRVRTPRAVRELFESHFPDVVDLASSYAEDVLQWSPAPLKTVRCDPYHHGRTVLIGDSAHTLVPFFGQGINCSFEDVRTFFAIFDRNLTETETGHDAATALAATLPAYTEWRRPAGEAIADLSLAMASELKDRSGDVAFQARKRLEKELHLRHPGLYVPLYHAVAFTDTPYQDAVARHERHRAVLDELCSRHDPADEVELIIAEYAEAIGRVTPGPRNGRRAAGAGHLVPDPRTGRHVVPGPQMERSVAPAPRVEQHIVPGPQMEQSVAPAPWVEQRVAAGPRAERYLAPGPRAEQGVVPAPSAERRAAVAPGTDLHLDSAQQKELLDVVAARLMDFHEDLSKGNHPAWYRVAAAEPPRAEQRAPRTGTAVATLLDEIFDSALPDGMMHPHPGFMAHVPSGGLFQGAVGEFVARSLNRFAGAWAAAPGFARLEANVIDWFCSLMGYGEGSFGYLTTGGSIANFMALRCALERLPEHQHHRAAVYVSEQGHFSVAKAARLAGIGVGGHRTVPTDGAYRMDLVALREMIERDVRYGTPPACVVATAGTTNTGAVDDLRAVAALCREHGVWFHVDACFGGFFRLTRRGRVLLDGIEEADSIAVDAHKSLFLPHGSSALLVRDKTTLKQAFAIPDAAYIPELSQDDDRPDFMDYGPELTREFRGLTAWLPIKMHGINAFERCLDDKLDLAEDLARRLAAVDGIDIVSRGEPHLPTVALKVRAGDPADANDAAEADRLTERACELICSRGNVYVATSELPHEGHVIRACIMHHQTDAGVIDRFVDDVRWALRRLGEE